LQLVIAVVFDLCLLDVLAVLLAKKNDVIFNIFKLKGYWYDKQLHEDVATYIGDK